VHVRKEPSLVTHTAAAFLRPLFPIRSLAEATAVIVADMFSNGRSRSAAPIDDQKCGGRLKNLKEPPPDRTDADIDLQIAGVAAADNVQGVQCVG
jgi:hypothetical protein